MSNLILGKKAIIEQLKKNNVLSVHSLSLFPEIKKICDEKNIVYKIENKIFFKDISSQHQGIVAFSKKTDYLVENFDVFIKRINDSPNKRKIIVILDRIEDVGNFGAIIRTCNAFNVDGMVIKNKNQAIINEFVIKSSMGSIYNSNILKVPNLSGIIEILKKHNYWIVASTLDESINVNDQEFNFDTCLIIGNEKDGISKNLISKSDFKVNIQMFGSVQSLNVSVATGILLNCIKNYHLKE